MEYLDAYRDRMSSNDNVVRNRKVEGARSRAIKHFEQDPSFFALNGLEPDTNSVIVKRVRVINESVLKQLNPERVYSKYIVPHPEEPMISGTMLFGLYDVDWLVTAVTGLGDVHQQATLQKLNEIITTKIDGIPQSFPAVVNGVSRLGDGVLEMNLYTIPDELIKIRVQNNAMTRGILRNTRLKITNKMYTLTKVDVYTDDGVLNWIAKEDLLEAGDEVFDEPTDSGDSQIKGPETITRARDYVFSIPDAENVTWELSGAPLGVVKIKSQTGNSVTVRAEKTKLLKLTLTAKVNGTVIAEKTFRLVSLL